MKSKPVLISIALIAQRLQAAPAVLNSLINQDMPASEIHVFASNQPYLHDNGIRNEHFPAEVQAMQDNGFINIHFTANIGPYRKLLPILQERWSEDCLIITADDDTIYPSDFVANLVNKHRAFPDSIITNRARYMTCRREGLSPYRSWPVCPAEIKLCTLGHSDKKCHWFPTGKDGVLYRPHFFTDRIFDRAFLSLAPYNDDVWFKFMSLRKSVYVVLADQYDDQKFIEMPKNGRARLWDTNSDSTFHLNNDKQIENVISYCETIGEPVWFSNYVRMDCSPRD